MNKCTNCQAKLPGDAKFCPECGQAQTVESLNCPKCQAQNTAEARFCIQCGNTLQQQASPDVPKKKSALSTPQLSALLVVGLVAVIVSGVYYYLNFVEPLAGKEGTAQAADLHDHDHENEGTAHVGNAAGQQPSAADIQQVADNLKNDPNSADLNTQMGNVLFDSGKYSEAIPYYQKSLSLSPNNPDVIVDLGVCYFNMNDLEKAKTNFELAYQQDPNHVNALYNLGVVAVQNGQVNELIHYWNKLQEVAPDSPQAQRAMEMLNQIHQQVQQFSGGGDKDS